MDDNILVGIITGIATALVTLYIAERRIQMRYITYERTKWRNDIREKTLKLHKAITKRQKEEIAELHTEFTIRLNPNDCKDNKILDSIKLPEEGKEDEHINDFSKRIAHLLKHDWERSKREAKWLSFMNCEPKRRCSD